MRFNAVVLAAVLAAAPAIAASTNGYEMVEHAIAQRQADEANDALANVGLDANDGILANDGLVGGVLGDEGDASATYVHSDFVRHKTDILLHVLRKPTCRSSV